MTCSNWKPSVEYPLSQKVQIRHQVVRPVHSAWYIDRRFNSPLDIFADDLGITPRAPRNRGNRHTRPARGNLVTQLAFVPVLRHFLQQRGEPTRRAATLVCEVAERLGSDFKHFERSELFFLPDNSPAVREPVFVRICGIGDHCIAHRKGPECLI